MIRLNKEISERAGVSKTVVKKLKTSDMVAQSTAAVNYIMSKIQTDDATLYASMDQTVAESTTELAQLPEFLKTSLVTESPTGFFCSFNTTIPFIYNNGRVVTFNRTDSAEEVPFATLFAEAMGAYMANKLNDSIQSKLNSTKNKKSSARNVSANLALVDTKIASIVSTY